MSSSIITLSRRLSRSLLTTSIPHHHHHQLPLLHFSTNPLFDADESPLPDSPDDSASSTQPQRSFFDRPLENGLDPGIYRAILVGQAGQKPLQKTLKNGTVVTLLSLGTGGIRNNRRPLDHENPKDYANRCAVQWHRVCVYPQRLGNLAVKHIRPGSILYVEGNLETLVFADPVTGLVRRIREVAIRRNGRIVFLSQGGDAEQQTQEDEPRARSVGYY